MSEEAISILKQPLFALIPLLFSLPLLALSSLRGLLLWVATGVGDVAGCLRRQLESRCAVCLEDIFCDEEKFRVLPECGHGFHAECLDRWLKFRRSCPLCRTMVAGERRSFRKRLLAALLARFCRWMDSQFDSELTLVFCQNL
ncbi:hypothetical protein CDL15_Pgr013743 [Punica granatum]|uniref:RING-type E3 ubiquitin transferase n=1 Tax=Punica granatum TaxID=22663 RepID=A0A218W1K5_PUNGR|nr:hypothetical protein CDL15_Pgr013743 [Punica granatum]PKI37938.1 hypothetical protein CRG98_041675 [Punica granatum]